jgi:hypothetical protein
MNPVFKRILLSIIVTAFIVVALVATIPGWKYKFFGNEVLVDLKSARVRRVQYRLFIIVSDHVETNAVAQIALRMLPNDSNSHWVLAERGWLMSRTFDEFQETRLLDAIGEMNRLVNSPMLSNNRKQTIVVEFINVLGSQPPKEVDAFVHELELKSWG